MIELENDYIAKIES